MGGEEWEIQIYVDGWCTYRVKVLEWLVINIIWVEKST